MGKLYAVADLHLSHRLNRDALEKLAIRKEDTLILAGDVGETAENLHLAFSTVCAKYKDVIWCPGNHELYTLPPLSDLSRKRGKAKYDECVDIARSYGVLTPEDDHLRWEGEGGPVIIVPVFTLYDYSFRPQNVTLEGAIAWAKEEGIEATDEALLLPDPLPSRQEWCAQLVQQAEAKLDKADKEDVPLVIVNHWPLREDLVHIPLVPRFKIWCGTKKTENWHKKYNAKVVVTGHLHVPRTDWIDGVRFEECSLGYPRQWKTARDRGYDINDLIREILPGPTPPKDGVAATQWRMVR